MVDYEIHCSKPDVNKIEKDDNFEVCIANI